MVHKVNIESCLAPQSSRTKLTRPLRLADVHRRRAEDSGTFGRASFPAVGERGAQEREARCLAPAPGHQGAPPLPALVGQVPGLWVFPGGERGLADTRAYTG